MTRETAEPTPKVAEQKRTTSKTAPLFKLLLFDACGRGESPGPPCSPHWGGEDKGAYCHPGSPLSPAWGHGSPQGLGGGQAVLQDPPTPRPWQVLISWPRTPWSHQHFRCQHDPCREVMRRSLLRWKKLFQLHFNPPITLPSSGTVSNISVSRGFPDGPMVKTLPPNAGDVGSIPGRGTKIPCAWGD